MKTIGSWEYQFTNIGVLISLQISDTFSPSTSDNLLSSVYFLASTVRTLPMDFLLVGHIPITLALRTLSGGLVTQL